MLFNQGITIPDSLQSEALTVTLLEEHLRYSLRVKAGDLTAFKKATGLKLPSKINTVTDTKGTLCAKLGPDEWFLRAPISERAKLETSLAKASKEYVCSVTEISHRNVAFDVSGPDAAKLINVGCSLDLHIDKFPVGKATRTAFESAAIILIRNGEHQFQIEVWRSFAPYLRDFFTRVVTS